MLLFHKIEEQKSNKIIFHFNFIMVKKELEQQLLQLSANEKLYIIQLLAQSLTTQNTHLEQPSKLSEFFRQSPLGEIASELDLSRDRSLSHDAFTP